MDNKWKNELIGKMIDRKTFSHTDPWDKKPCEPIKVVKKAKIARTRKTIGLFSIIYIMRQAEIT